MIAIIVVVIAVFINFSSLSNTAAFRRESSPRVFQPTEEQLSPTQQPVSPLDMLQGKSTFDLKGPLVCSYSSADFTATAQIHNKNIYLKHTQKEAGTGYVLINNETLYLWEQGSYQGKKVGNVGQYLNLFDTFSMFTTPDMLFSLLPQSSGTKMAPDQISAFTDSCQKKEVDDVIFTVPTAVKFTETDIQKLQIPEGLMEE